MKLKRRLAGASSGGRWRAEKSCWTTVIANQKREGASVVERERETVERCDQRHEAREFGCRRRAKKDEQICEVQESKVPNCRQSRRVLELVEC